MGRHRIVDSTSGAQWEHWKPCPHCDWTASHAHLLREDGTPGPVALALDEVMKSGHPAPAPEG